MIWRHVQRTARWIHDLVTLPFLVVSGIFLLVAAMMNGRLTAYFILVTTRSLK